LFILLLPLNLRCDETDAAKEYFLKGKALVEEGAYKKAIVELNASYEINPVPIVLYNIGLCYDELHKYADAVYYYRLFTEKSEGEEEELLAKVKERMEVLEKFLGTIEIEVNEEGAEIILDDKLIGTSPVEKILIETGEHEFIVRKTGFYEIKKHFTVVSGKTVMHAFQLKKIGLESKKKEDTEVKGPDDTTGETGETKPEETKSRKTLAAAPFWSMVAVTGLAAAGAVVTGALAVKDNNTLSDMKKTDEWESVRDRRDTLALTTDILIGAAAAGAVTTLVLYFFTDFKKEKKTGAFFYPSGSSGLVIGYEGRF